MAWLSAEFEALNYYSCTSTTRMQNRGLASKIPDHMRRTTPLWNMPAPYQNTIGGRHPSIWAGPLELNLHSYVVGAR